MPLSTSVNGYFSLVQLRRHHMGSLILALLESLLLYFIGSVFSPGRGLAFACSVISANCHSSSYPDSLRSSLRHQLPTFCAL
jgi:hypothetical protein